MRMRLLVTSALATVLVAGAAQAADLLTKAPVMKAPVAPFSWTGFYIGGHAGYGWGDKKWSDWFNPLDSSQTVPGPDASYHVNGPLGGGQIGYNFQYGWTVFGIEADVSAANITGRGNNDPRAFDGIDPAHPTHLTGFGCLDLNGACTTKIDALGTITARLGVAVDRVLFYGKGGAAWVHEKHTVRGFDTDLPNNPAANFTSTTSQTRWGWTAGAGIEYALSNNWSAKIEYNYLDFGKDQVVFNLPAPVGFDVAGTLHQTMHVVKGGLNYRFGY
jgi:outer membrane immunogenic protein